MRRTLLCRCSAITAHTEGPSSALLPILKDYRKLAELRRQEEDAIKKYNTFKDVPLRYQLLEVLPSQGMAHVKLKYLMACRKHHPEVGGDPEMFLRVSLAYQDCMKDYGIETINKRVVNLGNFQSCDHELKNYLEARSKITDYIPLSTLDDHIKELEEVQSRLGTDITRRLGDNSDDAFWLIEDIEKVVELTGVKTVKLAVLEDGTVSVKPIEVEKLTSGDADKQMLGDGTEASLQPPSIVTDSSDPKFQSSEAEASGESAHGDAADSGPKAVIEAEVSVDDIATLTAKHNVQKRDDVAGIAARVATGVMNNTREKSQARFESLVAAFLAFNVGFLIYAYLDAYSRAKHEEEARPEVKDHITTNTMLPWWGNDSEYESQVKRIFLEEWRRARSSSRRVQVFQDGVMRESLPSDQREALDVAIFEVTSDRLLKMREHAEAQKGRQ